MKTPDEVKAIFKSNLLSLPQRGFLGSQSNANKLLHSIESIKKPSIVGILNFARDPKYTTDKDLQSKLMDAAFAAAEIDNTHIDYVARHLSEFTKPSEIKSRTSDPDDPKQNYEQARQFLYETIMKPQTLYDIDNFLFPIKNAVNSETKTAQAEDFNFPHEHKFK